MNRVFEGFLSAGEMKTHGDVGLVCYDKLDGEMLIPNRPVYDHENVRATMDRFYCPSFTGDINVDGFHFHFLSDDHSFGGHVMEFTGKKLQVALDQMTQYTFILPESRAFERVGFDKKFQYQQK